MKELIDKIKSLNKKHFSKIIEIRRHLHQYPELSFEEEETTKYIASTLKKLGLKDISTSKYAKTGVVANLEGKDPKSKTVALRADIDALPINEQNKISFKSKNPGVMHACGHDVHTSSLIGVAMILLDLKNEFKGTVRLIFQPGEETPPGGAIDMINNGVLKNPVPASILGQHVTPLIPVGKVGFTRGKMLASNNNVMITVKGVGGHAASPHLAIDPILIASHIVVALQQIVSRNMKPLVPSVLSLCSIEGGEAYNVIPNEVIIKGTFRTLDEKWHSIALKKIEKVSKGIAESMGATCEIEVQKGYHCTVNDDKTYQRAVKYSKEFLGDTHVVEKEPSLGSEDFSNYQREIPGCFYWLGVANKAKNINSYVHTSRFMVDEEALKISPGLMTYLTLKELEDNT